MSNYFGAYFTPTYFAQGYFGPSEADTLNGTAAGLLDLTGQAFGPRTIVIESDDGGEVIKRYVRDKALALLADAVEEITTPEAAVVALEALQPVAVEAQGKDELAAVAAISEALRTAMERQQGHASLVRIIGAEIERIGRIRKRRRDEAALLLLM